jgi:hypothetical protein
MSEQGNTASTPIIIEIDSASLDYWAELAQVGQPAAEFTGNPSDICTRPGCTHDRGSHLHGTGACGYCGCPAMETAR